MRNVVYYILLRFKRGFVMKQKEMLNYLNESADIVKLMTIATNQSRTSDRI